MGAYSPLASSLLYSGPGAGKTMLATSAFWDWRKQEEVAYGKYISLGSEDNEALGIPQSCRETKNGTSLRLTSPLLDSTGFLSQFGKILARFVKDAEEGHPLDVLVIDSLSEFDLMFEATYKQAPGDAESNFAMWNALLAEMFALMQRASHTALKCHVITTARVMERKRTKSGRAGMAMGDPEYVDFDYYPSVRGSFRLHLPHYYQFVFYMETVMGKDAKGRIVPVHKTNVVRNGGFYVKNQYEHAWLENEDKLYVVNETWPNLWRRLKGAKDKGIAAEAVDIVETEDDVEGGATATTA